MNVTRPLLIFFEILIYLQYFSFSSPPSKPTHTSLPFLFKFMAFLFTNCYCMHICIYINSPSNIRSYTCKGSPTWLPNCELAKDNINEQEKLNGEKPTRPQPYTNNNKLQRKAGNWRGGSLQGRIGQLVNLENLHTISIIWTEQVILTTTSLLVESKRSTV